MRTYEKSAIIDFIQDWITSTERIIGAGLKRNRVKISDTSQKNIRIKLIQSLDNLSIEFHFRDALRFVDMGAGRGYHKGVKVGRSEIGSKPRRKKRIMNKPLYSRIARLQEGVAFSLIEEFTITLQNLTENGN